MAHRGEVPNFASFLRITCMRYLRRQLMAAERERPTVAPPKVVALKADSAQASR
jgi:predicted DNA-binding ribbon-helix-helix protein